MQTSLYKSIMGALDAEQNQLHIFKLDRSVALRNMLALFEVELANLYLLDETAALIGEEQPVPFHSNRDKLEDALCRMIPKVWQKCPTNQSLNTRFDTGTLDDSIAAMKFQTTRNIVESMLEFSRDGTMQCVVDGRNVRFNGVPGLSEIYDTQRLRNVELESEVEERMISAIRAAESKKDTHLLDYWLAGLSVPMKMHGFEPGMSLGSYSVHDYSLVWAALLTITNPIHLQNREYMRRTLFGTKADPRKFVLLLKENDLEGRIANLTNLDNQTTKRVLADLKYKGSPHPTSIFLWPLVPLGGGIIALPPSFLLGVELFRNLRQRLIVESLTVYQQVKDKLADNVLRYLEERLGEKGFRSRSKIVVRDSKGAIKTDIDLLAIQDDVILVTQVKNINPHDTPNERSRVARDVREAQNQLEVSLEYVSRNVENLLGGFTPKLSNRRTGYKVKGLIVSGVRPQVGISVPRYDIIDIVQFDAYLASVLHPSDEGSPNVEYQDGLGWCRAGPWRIEAEMRRPNGMGDEVVNFGDVLPIENMKEYLTLGQESDIVSRNLRV